MNAHLGELRSINNPFCDDDLQSKLCASRVYNFGNCLASHFYDKNVNLPTQLGVLVWNTGKCVGSIHIVDRVRHFSSSSSNNDIVLNIQGRLEPICEGILVPGNDDAICAQSVQTQREWSVEETGPYPVLIRSFPLLEFACPAIDEYVIVSFNYTLPTNISFTDWWERSLVSIAAAYGKGFNEMDGIEIAQTFDPFACGDMFSNHYVGDTDNFSCQGDFFHRVSCAFRTRVEGMTLENVRRGRKRRWGGRRRHHSGGAPEVPGRRLRWCRRAGEAAVADPAAQDPPAEDNNRSTESDSDDGNPEFDG